MAERAPCIVAVVPARGDSKGIPRKNLAPLAGKPLIAYTINVAQQASVLDRVIVSTEDSEIADVALQYGAEVPFLRPEALAKDNIPMLPVFRHAIRWLQDNEAYCPDAVVSLLPTSPLRSIVDINAAIETLLSSGCHAVRTVSVVDQHPYRMLHLKGDRVSKYVNHDDPRISYLRQSLPVLYRWNGVVDAIRTDVVFNNDNFYGEDVRAVVVPKERSIDIDDAVDLKIAECFLKMKANHSTFEAETDGR